MLVIPMALSHGEAAMSTHVFYYRACDGSIKRLDNLICTRPFLLGSYPYEQKLVGFPEEVVFWVDATGESVGVAPILLPQNGE